MRRVVVTGIGIVASIGNNKAEVLGALRNSRSGLEHLPEMQELGFRCSVGGRVKGLELEWLSKRVRQTMSPVAHYAAVAAWEALADAQLVSETLQGQRSAIVVGTSFGGISENTRSEVLLHKYKNPSRLGATMLVKGMHSTVSANLASWLGVQGRAYSLCSSFCSGLDNIGHAYELLARGSADVVLCGASEESTWRQIGSSFDALGAMPSGWNDSPEKACRPYDRDRAGTVFSEGAGILILEPLECAEARGVEPYAEIVGYGSANDGFDMFHPSGEGLMECLQQALAAAETSGVHRIDYINSHGTGTKLHDALEVRMIRKLFGARSPFVSSTKALCGHSLGATGAHEAIYTLLMMRHGFIAPTVNLEQVASDCEGVSHVQSCMDTSVENALTFNAGLGGTNACMIFRKL